MRRPLHPEQLTTRIHAQSTAQRTGLGCEQIKNICAVYLQFRFKRAFCTLSGQIWSLHMDNSDAILLAKVGYLRLYPQSCLCPRQVSSLAGRNLFILPGGKMILILARGAKKISLSIDLMSKKAVTCLRVTELSSTAAGLDVQQGRESFSSFC